MLFMLPFGYNPCIPINGNEVSPYLTNYLAPTVHNKAQYGRPFELVIEESGINDIIARNFCSEKPDGLKFEGPFIKFLPGSVLLMGKSRYGPMHFVSTIVIEPEIDEKGDLSLRISGIKAGRAPLPFAAAIIRNKMQKRLEKAISEKVFAKLGKLLLKNETIKPIIEVAGEKIRIQRITTQKKKLILHFVPQGR